MTREEFRVEILRLYENHTPRYMWGELNEIFTRDEKNGQTIKYPRPLYWLLRKGT